MNSYQSEREILVALAQDDEHAFQQIYQLYSPKLFGKLMKLVKSVPHAQEILQDVFLKLWEHRKSIDPDKSFHSFIYKIAENKVYDFFRKTARDKKLAAQLTVLSTVDHIFIEDIRLNDEKLPVLQMAIESLPPQRRQVFKLCKLESKSYKEVSETLGISVSTISDHIVKGTKAIREYFGKHDTS